LIPKRAGCPISHDHCERIMVHYSALDLFIYGRAGLLACSLILSWKKVDLICRAKSLSRPGVVLCTMYHHQTTTTGYYSILSNTLVILMEYTPRSLMERKDWVDRWEARRTDGANGQMDGGVFGSSEQSLPDELIN